MDFQGWLLSDHVNYRAINAFDRICMMGRQRYSLVPINSLYDLPSAIKWVGCLLGVNVNIHKQ